MVLLLAIALNACGGAPVASSTSTAPAGAATAKPAASATLAPTEAPALPTETAQPSPETALRIDISPSVAQRSKPTHFEATGFVPRETVGVNFIVPPAQLFDAGMVTADATGKAIYDLTLENMSGNDTPGWWIVTFASAQTQKSIQRGFELTYADDATLQSAQATAQAQVNAGPVAVTPATVTRAKPDLHMETSIFKAGEELEFYIITPEGLYDALPIKIQTSRVPFILDYSLNFAFRPVTPGTWRVRFVSKTSGKVGEGSFTVTKEAFPTPEP